ncbi:hypothetical protein BJAS_P2596 [Bathymodiolus japonicus methanotrophic gill symbiont]|uniref:hypothetical protein n=1 Tax=Bathymodiolus japonicus methanotrophic gill symbiont TaxID=113269 RepID=UPI001B3DF90A|nr:hypothetical protein [Bathymodiolus japonicus methanotrophic gill symbiont]GFO72392.1 hypothetical protein BJAS_P2596 [Bathymodiolus japonicus methanotrophic gill symbiont]
MHLLYEFRYFNSINKGIDQIIRVRGGKEIKVTVSSARLKVSSHSKKRFVIALKYDGENDYRYLVATDLTWRTQDIIQAYTLRWLVEVFFEDWKLYERKSQMDVLLEFITSLLEFPDPGDKLKELGELIKQARHATSRNSGTPVAVIRSPTQRIGDAPAALRPPQTEHKAAQSWLPQMALRLFGIKF